MAAKEVQKKRFRISVKEAQDEKQAQEQTSTKEIKIYNQTNNTKYPLINGSSERKS